MNASISHHQNKERHSPRRAAAHLRRASNPLTDQHLPSMKDSDSEQARFAIQYLLQFRCTTSESFTKRNIRVGVITLCSLPHDHIARNMLDWSSRLNLSSPLSQPLILVTFLLKRHSSAGSISTPSYKGELQAQYYQILGQDWPSCRYDD